MEKEKIPQSEDFVISGGKPLSGSIATQTSKNGSVALICAALLNRGTTTLRGVARIEEVSRLAEILRSIGVAVDWIGGSDLRIVPPESYDLGAIDAVAARRVRSGLMLVGPLAHRVGSFRLPAAGGCRLGHRPVEPHWLALAELGARVSPDDGGYRVEVDGWRRGADIVMREASDTATVNALLAAALIPDRTTIRFASSNYQVQETCFFLERLGVSIDGVGTATLVVRGISDACADVEHANSEDPIDAMMLVALAATTSSSLEVRRAPIDFLRLELCRLKDMGLDFDVSAPYRAENGRTELADLQVRPSELVAPTLKLHPMPYPGLNVDNLPFFFPIAAQASGETSFNDWMFENRLVSLMDLAKLGAEIELVDAHRARVRGRRPFAPRQLVAPDALRPAACVMIGMLAAKGTSILRDVYQIRRGYERIDERLRSIGADVQVISPA